MDESTSAAVESALVRDQAERDRQALARFFDDAARADALTNPFQEAEIDVQLVIVDWTDDEIAGPRDLAIDWAKQRQVIDPAAGATRTENFLAETTGEEPYVRMSLWGLDLELRRDPVALRALLELAFVLGGSDGVDALFATLDRLANLPPSPRTATSLRAGPHFAAARGAVSPLSEHLEPEPFANAEQIFLASIRSEVAKVAPDFGDEIHRALEFVEQTSQTLLSKRLRVAELQARLERVRYGATMREFIGPGGGPGGPSRQRAYSLADNEHTDNLRNALDQLASYRRQTLDPLEREETIAKMISGAIDLVELFARAERLIETGGRVLDGPTYASTEARRSMQELVAQRREALADYLVMRGAAATVHPVIHRIAELVDSGDDPDLPRHVWQATQDVLQSVKRIRGIASERAVPEKSPTEGGPADPARATAKEAAEQRSIWSYPTVIYAAIGGKGGFPPETIPGAAAREVIDRVTELRATQELKRTLLELGVAFAPPPVGPIVASILAGAHILRELNMYADAMADFQSTLDPLEALSQQDPSLLDVMKDLVPTALTSL
jgi:hypothetical protein